MSSSLPTHQSGFASSPALSQGPLQPPTHRYSFLLSTSQMWTPCQWQAVDPRSRSPRCFESVTELSTECWPSSVFHRKKEPRGRDCADRCPYCDRLASSTRGIRDLRGPVSITSALRAEPGCSLLPAKDAVCHPTPATNSCPLPSQSASVPLSSPGSNTARSQ